MIYRVGQRVKRVAHCCDPIPLGSTGTVSGGPNGFGDIPVKWDAGYAFSTGYAAHTLAPLTDPGAQEFIESLKKLAREPNTLKDPAPNWDHA